MATVDFIHFCDHAFFDANSRPCLIGIHGHLFAKVFPHSLAMLTVAIGLRVAAGENATVHLELGPPNEPAKRKARLLMEGPPLGGPLTEALRFIPFETVQMYFDRPQIVEVRVLENNKILASKSFAVALKEPVQKATQDQGIHLP